VAVGVSVAGTSAEATSSEVEAAVAEVESPCRKVANQPPKNRAVMAIQTKIDNLARWARRVSSSLTMGKMALLASRWERSATMTAMIVAPKLKAAKIKSIVGRESILTPQF
jgi:hypothetical protein